MLKLKRTFNILFCLLLLTFFSQVTLAKEGHLKLLAVSELENGSMEGGVADLYLETQEGTGRIFLDTYPLSKFDTQLSIRFAKDVACKFAGVDCTKYDFLYTIRAGSQIIGGPSAGAAASILTYSMLKNVTLDENVAITGTINSGRLIGSVGGIQEKIEGAQKNQITKVLIPMDEVIKRNEDNTTTNMTEYGASLGIEVYGVNDMEEAIYYFSGIDLRKQPGQIKLNEHYLTIMKNISDGLCSRSEEIISLIANASYFDNSTHFGDPINKTLKDGIAMVGFAKSILENNSFYSSASQCYGANVKLEYVYLMSLNESDSYYKKRLAALNEALNLYEADIDKREYSTISELQTSMIIRQRLEEAKEYIEAAQDYYLNFSLNSSINSIFERDKAIYNMALAIERLKTCSLWAEFYSLEGPEYVLNKDTLQASCDEIIEDSKARLQYARLYLPGTMMEQEEKLKKLKKIDNPEYCIAEASMIRADINALTGAFGLTNDDIERSVKRKLAKAAEVLSEETEQGRFPILGYSYYEYANALLLKDPMAAVIYSQYALEISSLDIYLKKQPVAIVEKKHNAWDFMRVDSMQIVFMLSLCIAFFILGVYAARRHFTVHHHKKKK